MTETLVVVWPAGRHNTVYRERNMPYAPVIHPRSPGYPVIFELQRRRASHGPGTARLALPPVLAWRGRAFHARPADRAPC